jgi:Arc/MetJ-type ribon-helix-helix transcriptional regulator
MTITLNPHQEEIIRAAIRAGQVGSVEELIDRALAALPHANRAEASPSGRTIAEQGLGLFASPEDAALLDEVVSLAYAERRRPSRRKPAL